MFPGALAVLRVLGWLVCGAWTLSVFALMWLSMGSAQTAIQEATLAALGAASLIFGYVMARCLDSIAHVLSDASNRSR
jgi:hypothetical protein